MAAAILSTRSLNQEDGDVIWALEDENIDEEKEYEAWKLRELKRLKRDFLERTTFEREQAEILRRRNLTDVERRKEDLLLGCDESEKP